MKRGTPDHPKTLDLAEAIQSYLQVAGLELPFDFVHTYTCGLLERLWHFTARYAPSGLVATHSAQRIARAIGWSRDAEWLVRTMTTVGYFDELKDVGLYVHDWHQHSDDAADKWLADKGLRYGNGAAPRRRSQQVTTRSRPRRDKSSQSEPSSEPSSEPPPPPSPPKSADASAPAGTGIEEEGEGAWKLVLSKLRKLEVNDAETAIRDARKNGLSPEDVLELIVHYQSKPGAWQPGGLHFRIRTGVRGLSPKNGWPDPDRVAMERLAKSGNGKSAVSSESQARDVILAGRKAKKPEEVIRGELAAAGLEWPK